MAAKRIMVVDDEANIRELLKRCLEKEGYSVLLAVDGLDAIEKVKSEKPDLIILDLQLPKMDGYEVLKRVKIHPQGAHIPIIVLTGLGEEPHRRRSLERGAVGFFAKPFSLRQLVATAKGALGDA